ncbi:hypothetical protein JKG47_15775 [Acidithiobacillus sp. MC6.1]|nr:hypothetical protein [Acidithiobacillus sp. MC6.1]
MTHIMKSPFSLYRALQLAAIPDETARETADAVRADLDAILNCLASQQSRADDYVRMNSARQSTLPDWIVSRKGKTLEDKRTIYGLTPELDLEIRLLKNSLVEWLLAVSVAQTVFIMVILALVFSVR